MVSSSTNNLLLRALNQRDYSFVEPHLRRVPLSAGHVIVSPGEELTFVCFPECGVTSIADVLPDGRRVEVALVGREGMTNSQLLLGALKADYEPIVQVGAGSTLRLEASVLKELCLRSSHANALFLRFVYALFVQSSRTLTSNTIHSLPQRLSRWILMYHDRLIGDELRLCHDHIARLLGVRRATVTDTLHILEGEGALRCNRGRLIVRSREKLESLAGDAYGFAEARYSDTIAVFGKSSQLALHASASY